MLQKFNKPQTKAQPKGFMKMSPEEKTEWRKRGNEARREYNAGTRQRPPRKPSRFFHTKVRIQVRPTGWHYEVLFALMVLRGYAIKDLAIKLDLSPTAFRAMAYGDRPFEPGYAERLCLFFGFPKEVLFSRPSATMAERIWGVIKQNHVEGKRLLILNDQMIHDLTDLLPREVALGLDFWAKEEVLTWTKDPDGKYYIVLQKLELLNEPIQLRVNAN